MWIGGYVLREEPCTDPYARFCGQTGADAPSDPINTRALDRSYEPSEATSGAAIGVIELPRLACSRDLIFALAV